MPTIELRFGKAHHNAKVPDVCTLVPTSHKQDFGCLETLWLNIMVAELCCIHLDRGAGICDLDTPDCLLECTKVALGFVDDMVINLFRNDRIQLCRSTFSWITEPSSNSSEKLSALRSEAPAVKTVPEVLK